MSMSNGNPVGAALSRLSRFADERLEQEGLAEQVHAFCGPLIHGDTVPAGAVPVDLGEGCTAWFQLKAHGGAAWSAVALDALARSWAVMASLTPLVDE